MAIDKETIENARRWITTIIVIVIVPVSGLWMGYNKLQILQEVRSMYLEQRVYSTDRLEFSVKLEALTVKMDTVLQNQATQAAQQIEEKDRLRAIEARIEKK
jgi:hypothetical protein